MIASFIELFNRDLKKLKKEINSYQIESELWVIQHQIKNSAGSLALHLVGNLQHFIGHVIGEKDYIRNRDAEFSKRNVSRAEILNEIDITAKTITESLEPLTESDLLKTYPLQVLEKETSTLHFLLHLLTHLNYHIGQVNYHRRLLTTNE